MMYCASCGKQIADDAALCPYCKTPVSQKDALADLVAAARAGDQDAVSALYEKTYSKVYYTVKSMIKDEDAVFDIVQDTYIKAFAHLDSFQGDARFLPWARQIAANTARDWLKKKRPMLFTELGSGDEQDTPVEELFPDERGENLPEQVIDQKETQRLLREMIEELPEDQRAAIGMFYYQEMSVKEIAASMEVSESAVKSRLMYGRNKIEKKVRELEKQGTKLYGLSPLPFLLLLFRSQEAYAAAVPDSRILQAILASRPVGAAAAAGAAKNAGTATAAAGSEAAGTAGTGTAAAAGGLGALKTGLIAFAAVSLVGLGAFGASRLASRSAEPQEPSAVEDTLDQEEADPAGQEEPEAAEEAMPIDEALEQYRIIVSQADSYEYGESDDETGGETAGYLYALVQMRPDDPVPTLLLRKNTEITELTSLLVNVRLFQYDPDTKTVHQPTEVIEGGSVRSSHINLALAGDGDGIMSMSWSAGSGYASVSRITLEGDSLNRDNFWEGQLNRMPDSVSFTDSIAVIQIEWHEIGDLSPLDSWTAPAPRKEETSEMDGNGTLPTDGDRIVLTGTVGTYNYDEIVELQGQPDPNAPYHDVSSTLDWTYRVIVLDTPQTLRIRPGGWSGEEDEYGTGEALMIDLYYAEGMEQYEGQHITFSIDPDATFWPSDTGLPLGQPHTSDIHILD